MRGLAIGVDAGGTSTIAALSRDGALQQTFSGSGASPTALGTAGAADVIAQVIDAVCNGQAPDAIYVGAAGTSRDGVAAEIERMLRAHYPTAQIVVSDDVRIALRAAVPTGDGTVLIAGTGSIAYAERDGEHYRCGGYGYLLGDDGSGYAMGSSAIKYVLKYFDGRAPLDGFIAGVLRRLDTRTRPGLLANVYGSRQPIGLIASLAPYVIEAASAGERLAHRIVQAAALELGDLTKAVVKAAGLQDAEAPIVLAGGLLRENSVLSFLLETRLQSDLPQMRLIKRPRDAYHGALELAEALLGK
ncbi:MAG: BadF/BadG/BcrA/BcrD ATPase family protein [Candidatus Baltobacteraceae bacterium]